MNETVINGIIDDSSEMQGKIQYAIGMPGQKGDQGNPVWYIYSSKIEGTQILYNSSCFGNYDANKTPNVGDILISSASVMYVVSAYSGGSCTLSLLRDLKAATDQTYSPTSENAQSGVAVAEAVATKLVVKEYPTFNDFPAIKVSYVITGRTFDFAWGPPESYFTYQDGKWVSEVSNQNISLLNVPEVYTLDDCRNVTCKITYSATMSEYPDATVDSYGLSLSEPESGQYVAVYKETFTTAYSDSAHNPRTKELRGTFDIYFPDKLNSEISPNVLYRAADTGKTYYANLESYEWEEYTGTSVDATIIDKKQDELISGQSIRTLRGLSLLEGGDISVALQTDLSSYFLKSNMSASRSTLSTKSYTAPYINGLIKTSKQTSNNYTYGCVYIDNLINSAAGGGTYSVVSMDVTSQTVSSVTFDFDLNHNPLRLKKMILTMHATTAQTGNKTLLIKCGNRTIVNNASILSPFASTASNTVIFADVSGYMSDIRYIRQDSQYTFPQLYGYTTTELDSPITSITIGNTIDAGVSFVLYGVYE